MPRGELVAAMRISIAGYETPNLPEHFETFSAVKWRCLFRNPPAFLENFDG
jgi:hypothetical protein